MTDKELLKELQETEIIFGRQPKDRQEFFKKAGKENCVRYSLNHKVFRNPSADKYWDSGA